MAYADHWNSPTLLLGFVLLVVLFGSVSSYLKVRAEQATLREAIRSGQPIDPAVLRAVGDTPQDRRASLVIGGFVTIAVAVALVVFGFLVGRAEGESQLLPVMLGVAAFPGLIGLALLIAAAVTGRRD